MFWDADGLLKLTSLLIQSHYQRKREKWSVISLKLTRKKVNLKSKQKRPIQLIGWEDLNNYNQTGLPTRPDFLMRIHLPPYSSTSFMIRTGPNNPDGLNAAFLSGDSITLVRRSFSGSAASPVRRLCQVLVTSISIRLLVRFNKPVISTCWFSVQNRSSCLPLRVTLARAEYFPKSRYNFWLDRNAGKSKFLR